MKKTLFILVAVLTIGYFSYILFNTSKESSPIYSTTTSRNVKILKIDQNELETRIDFKVEAVLDRLKGFSVSSTHTYIQNSKGGEKLYVLRCDSIQMDKVYLDTVFENIKYTLVFPPIEKSIETIDFIGENTKIFDIELIPQKHSSVIPKELRGNWLKTDGSNEWKYGFHDNLIIYKNEFYNDFRLDKKGSSFVLEIEKDGVNHRIYIKKSKQNQLYIGENPENLNLFSTKKTIVKDYVLKNDIDSDSTIFKEGLAIYKGYIKDYHPKMDWEVKVYVPDVITSRYPEYVVKVNNDGTFYTEIPMNYAEKTYVRIGNIFETLFLEPKKTTVQFIDLAEHNAPYRNLKQQIARERKALFMGDLARLNNDMKSLENINYRVDYNYIEKTLNMSATQYKEHFLDIMKKEHDSLKAFIKNNPISQQAQKIKETEISFRASTDILSYELKKWGARQHMKEGNNKIDKEFNKANKLEIKEEITPAYYDFLNLDKLNNSSSLISGADYYFFMNRLRMGTQLVELGMFINYFEILVSNIHKRGIDLTTEEKSMLNALLNCKTGSDYKRITREEGRPWQSFQDKYDNVIIESRTNYMDEIREKKRRELFGIVNDFEREIIYGQNKASYIRTHHTPFNKWILEDIDSNISNENIKRILLKYSKLKELESSENKQDIDYFIHETPNVKNEDLFYTIIKKYKGKVVLIDFWATWCGSCLSAMDIAKPYKEKLKNEAIEFVYITGNSSPLKTWEAAVVGINGNHYRLNKEQWTDVLTMFNVTGIPHYLFIDKQGNIIRDDLHFPFISGEFEKLINKYL